MTATDGSKRDDERPNKGKNDEGRMSLVEHLTELRTRIVRSVIAIAVGAVVGWFLFPEIIELILNPYCDTLPEGSQASQDCDLRVDEPLEALSTRMMVAGYVGIGLAVPVWLWQAWRFIAPGLYPHERRHGIAFVALGVILFVAGALLAFWTLPRALEFLIDIGGQDFRAEFRARAYIEFVIKMMLAFGLGFEFPLVLVFLQVLGVLQYSSRSPDTVGYAIVGITILVAVITPSRRSRSALLALAGSHVPLLRGRHRVRLAPQGAAGAPRRTCTQPVEPLLDLPFDARRLPAPTPIDAPAGRWHGPLWSPRSDRSRQDRGGRPRTSSWRSERGTQGVLHHADQGPCPTRSSTTSCGPGTAPTPWACSRGTHRRQR